MPQVSVLVSILSRISTAYMLKTGSKTIVYSDDRAVAIKHRINGPIEDIFSSNMTFLDKHIWEWRPQPAKTETM